VRRDAPVSDRLTVRQTGPGWHPDGASPERTLRRGSLWLALAASLAGLAIALFLARLHVRAHAGFASFCAISETVNCDRVATSHYSVVLGLPVAIWGTFGYAVAVGLSAAALIRPRALWAAGLLLLVGAASVAASVALALVSELAIGAWCLLCVGSWFMALALFIFGIQACRPIGAGSTLRAALLAVWEKPGLAAAISAVAIFGVTGVAKAYPHYWERTAAPPAARSVATAPNTAARTVIIEYSDYECPFCARAHEQTRALLKTRPDLVLVHRQFPLDSACNPMVKRAIHPSACALARAGICAESQGRLSQMDDALFGNQNEGLSVLTLASRVGLNLKRFEACLSSRETERRLAADVEAGIRDGVRATPTFVVGNTARAGNLPLDLLPPPETKR